MIVDSSALLASLFGEEKGTWVEEQLNQHRTTLKMSVVNLAEVLILLRERQPKLSSNLSKTVKQLPIEFVPVTQAQAELASIARHEFRSLNFGDCFVYALAKVENETILTLDSDFKKTGLKIVIPKE